MKTLTRAMAAMMLAMFQAQQVALNLRFRQGTISTRRHKHSTHKFVGRRSHGLLRDIQVVPSVVKSAEKRRGLYMHAHARRRAGL